MGKFKEMLRTGALLGGMMAAEGARGQQPLETNQEAKIEKNETAVENADEAFVDKIQASSIEDFKKKLHKLLKKRSEDPLFDPDEYEKHFLFFAITHFDDYKSLPGAEDFVIESGEKYLKDFPNNFFSSIVGINNPLPEKLEKLVIRAAQEYPLEALDDSEKLEKFKKTYPQIILATLNRKTLARHDIVDLYRTFRVLSKLNSTHPAFDMLREILVEKLTIKAKEDPDELFELHVGDVEYWITEIFVDEKSQEEFCYTFLGGLIAKDKTESIVGNFELFAKFGMCRPLLFAAVQKMPERILERAENQLVGTGEPGKSPRGMEQGLKNFYFALISEALEKVKVGTGATDYTPSAKTWAFIKHSHPQFYDTLKNKYGKEEKFKGIFGKDANLELDPFTIEFNNL